MASFLVEKIMALFEDFENPHKKTLEPAPRLDLRGGARIAALEGIFLFRFHGAV